MKRFLPDDPVVAHNIGAVKGQVNIKFNPIKMGDSGVASPRGHTQQNPAALQLLQSAQRVGENSLHPNFSSVPSISKKAILNHARSSPPDTGLIEQSRGQGIVQCVEAHQNLLPGGLFHGKFMGNFVPPK